MAAQNGSQKTDSMSAEDSIPPPKGPTPDAPSSPEVSVVEDSFVASHPRLDTASKAVDSSQKRSRDHDDPLFEVIEQVKAVAHLPLDEEEGGESKTRPSSSAADAIDSDTDDEVPEPNAKVSKKYASGLPLVGSGKSKSFNQHAFQCMDPRATNARDDQNPNARTIQILDEMCRYYDKMGDNWRTLAYRRAITQLRKQKTKICTKDQAEALPFIGTRLAEKIEEIVLTDRLRRLDSTRDDPTDKILRLFLGIYGVGLSQAHKWIQAGHRTLDDLVKLTENQKFGIEHYKDFAARIPRAEVEAHGEYVRKALRRLDPRYEVIVGGSYRRGAKDSGDIDLIISKPGASASNMARTVFERLVPKLFSAGFLKASLATSHRDDGTKWLGASCLPGSKIWRRLDMLLVPEEEMGAALIYFTGNDIFNRSIRLLASKKGMRLNQRGLYADVMRGKNRVKLTEGTLLEGKSERKIFEILGVPWREPTERIC
jgi:DNA polymerase IV